MKKSFVILLAFLLLGSVLSGVASAKNVMTPKTGKEPVDLILKNGYVYTADEERSVAKTVAVRDGEIVFVGDNNSVMSLKGPDTEVINLKGKMVVPGFIDTHSHSYLKSEELFWVNLRPYKTIEEYGQAFKEYLEANPGIKQLRGVGWDETMVKATAAEKGVSPKELIDQYVSDMPVVIISNGHHGLWVNSKALEDAEVDENTPDPQGGIIERIPGTNEPSGILHEFSAQNLIINALPQPDFSVEEYKESILAFQEMSAERGVTSVLVPIHYPTESLLQAFAELDSKNALTVRFDLALWADEYKGTSQIARFKELRDTYQGDMFTIDSIKIFAEGNAGMVWDQEVLKETVAELEKEDFRVYTHLSGTDEQYNLMLDAYEYARNQNHKVDTRHAITHVQSDSQQVAERFKELGVIPDGHPVPKVFFDVGNPVITSSSDYPVRDYWPLTRVELGVKNLSPTYDDALDKMLISHTLSGANLIFSEDETGSIEVGKNADLVILENNLFEIPAEEIEETKTLMTIFNGEIVYTNPAFQY
nr:amidohydrolase [Fredinandcohnia onubensis]